MIRSSNLEAPYQTSFTNGSRIAVADVPVEKGGAGEGFGPHELLEAALATCLTITIQMYAARNELPLCGVQCEVRIDRTVPDAAILRYELSFDGPLTEEQLARLRDAASKCPVAKTLSGKINIETSMVSRMEEQP